MVWLGQVLIALLLQSVDTVMLNWYGFLAVFVCHPSTLVMWPPQNIVGSRPKDVWDELMTSQLLSIHFAFVVRAVVS